MLSFFVDPILRAPTLGTMLMGLACGLIGCLVFLKKRSLVGEALSHAAYPGVVVSVAIASFLFPFSEQGIQWSLLAGALVSCCLGLWALELLEKKLNISSDAALCFVLSIFFGAGILIASRFQLTHPLWFGQIKIFLFGQAATMVEADLVVYGVLALAMGLALFVYFPKLKILYFDPDFAKTVRMSTRSLDALVYVLLVLAIVLGMRSVGVVLMSAMLIAPPAAARQWVRSFGRFFLLSGFLGLLSGFLGNVLSVSIPRWIGAPHLSLPTGPMIVMCATTICVVSLLISPHTGLITRLLRMGRFRLRRRQENSLKALYKYQSVPTSWWLMKRLERKGWVTKGALSQAGIQEAEKLIRLHRLWEAYLVHMGQRAERVHANAEEMEHILTPELEKELQVLLGHPTLDPHAQPIPQERK